MEAPLQNPVKPTQPQQRDKSYLQRVPAVDQATRILYALARSSSSATLTELCREVGINKSKGLALLNTLQGAGLVQRSERTKGYRLGPGLLVLSRALLEQTDLASDSTPYLRELASATRSTAMLGVLTKEQFYVVARREPPEGPGVSAIAVRVGLRRPLYFGAHGKAILGVLPPDERERALAEEDALDFWAPSHPRDLDGLRAQLDEVARLGYAHDLGVTNPGVNAIGAALLDSQGRPVACLVVVGTFHPEMSARYGQKAAAMAQRMSKELAVIGPSGS